jgi:hypothetical protein
MNDFLEVEGSKSIFERGLLLLFFAEPGAAFMGLGSDESS